VTKLAPNIEAPEVIALALVQDVGAHPLGRLLLKRELRFREQIAQALSSRVMGRLRRAILTDVALIREHLRSERKRIYKNSRHQPAARSRRGISESERAASGGALTVIPLNDDLLAIRRTKRNNPLPAIVFRAAAKAAATVPPPTTNALLERFLGDASN